MQEVYLSIGSNLGDRVANIRTALSMLKEKTQLQKVSSLYETAPVDYLEQPSFINAACSLHTDLDPWPLLELLKDIERGMGRRPTVHGGPRVIDLDILLYGTLVVELPDLTIPHPRMAQRAFVLVPLAEIGLQLLHPVTGQSVASLLESLGPIEGVKPWSASAEERKAQG